MKIKQRPEDFQVEELAELATDGGDYAFYRLEKTGWTTPDALAIIRRRWNVDHRRIHYGGLKDRHAVTVQYLTIYRGPQRNLTHNRLKLTYLGQRSHPYSSRDFRANRFTIAIRAVRASEIEPITRYLERMPSVGLPNYFDDQRFGSVTASGEFVAQAMLRADWERALWLALAAPYEYDRRADKAIKQLLRERWGDWAYLREHLPRCHARSLAGYLADHPGDYKGAVARLRPELRSLYLSAYQSSIWNRMLAAWLRKEWPTGTVLKLPAKLGRYPLPLEVPAAAANLWYDGVLPLPCARLRLEPDAWWWPLAEEVLREEKLEWHQLRVPGLDRPYFSRGERRLSFRPEQWKHEFADDELNPQRRKLLLQFDLPRGSYATIVVKGIMAAARAGETPRR